jgi:hypothetical protein
LVIRAGGVVAATMIVVDLIMITVILVDGSGWWLSLVLLIFISGDERWVLCTICLLI